MNQIKKNNFTLRLKNGQFDIVDPRGFVYIIDVGFQDSNRVMYSMKYNNKLYTGSSPIDLLNTIVDGETEAPSDEYMNGFNDGVISVNRTDRYQEGFDKGYTKALGEAASILTAKAKEYKKEPVAIRWGTGPFEEAIVREQG